ncbi:MAG: hypothetical protein P8I55_07110 [Crocinitomix sp.]|nr:hypothetical protein [Crocinitomix sp.]
MKMTQCKIGKIGKVGLIDGNIIFVDIDSGSEIGMKHIYEFHNVAAELVKVQRKLYSIVSYGAYSTPTKAALEFCGKEEVNNKMLGRAVVVHGLGQFIIAKHTIKQRKSNVPTRIFTDKKKAKEWVTGLRAKNDNYQMVSNFG